jgi:uncharacterized SAM-binding protein YcdF (DUF218 family)
LAAPADSARRRARGWFVRLALAGAIAAAAGVGLVRFVAAIPTVADTPERRTDAIVVLTGGGDRLAEGLRLLSQGQAKKLLVSGVPRGIALADLLAGLPPEDTAGIDPGRLDCCVVLGHAADNTAENARETAAWMEAEAFTSLRLVTADYHMPRSVLEFHHALPNAVLLRHPVFPANVKREAWWQWPGTAALLLREYGKYLLALARGVLEGGTTTGLASS